jgi:hypothetical protein
MQLSLRKQHLGWQLHLLQLWLRLFCVVLLFCVLPLLTRLLLGPQTPDPVQRQAAVECTCVAGLCHEVLACKKCLMQMLDCCACAVGQLMQAVHDVSIMRPWAAACPVLPPTAGPAAATATTLGSHLHKHCCLIQQDLHPAAAKVHQAAAQQDNQLCGRGCLAGTGSKEFCIRGRI